MGEVSLFDFSCKNFSKPACGATIMFSPLFSAGVGNFGAPVDDADALLIYSTLASFGKSQKAVVLMSVRASSLRKKEKMSARAEQTLERHYELQCLRRFV